MQPDDPTTTTPAPRKRHHWIRWTLAGFGALILLIVIIGVAAGSGSKAAPVAPASTSAPAAAAAAQAIDPNGEQCAALDGTGYCPGDVAATPTPTVNPATTVTFKVTGTGDPSITYGTDSDNRDGGGTLGQLGDGNATPWTRSMTFDGNAQYYYISAQLEGSTGSITCTITASGPGDDPLIVATGHASGGYNICSAQAAPNDSTGTNWQTEG